MAGLSDNQENAVLNSVFRGVAYTVPTTPIKVSLHTQDPTDTGTVGEVTGGSYARQSVTFGAASAGVIANSGSVDFAGMPAGTVTHVGLWDSSGTPVFLGGGALTASKTVSAGDTFSLPVSDLTVSLD